MIVFFLYTFLIIFSFCIWYWYIVYFCLLLFLLEKIQLVNILINILNSYKLLLVNHPWLILWEYNRKAGQSQMFTKENTVKNSGKISSTTVFSSLLKKTKLYLTLRLSYGLYELICSTVSRESVCWSNIRKINYNYIRPKVKTLNFPEIL